MITSEFYRGAPETRAAILEALSASDRRVVANLTSDERDRHYMRLLVRLAVLARYAAEWAVIRDALTEILRAAPGVAVKKLNDLLEKGGLHKLSSPESPTPERGELEQELVHFSRIVDLEPIESAVGVKRLRKSGRIPGSLKVLCELMTVVRARHIQRGAVARPMARIRDHVTRDITESLTGTWSANDDPSYMMIVLGSRRRARLAAIYLFRELLQYLRPEEGMAALVAHCCETGSEWRFILAYLTPDGSHMLASWLPSREALRDMSVPEVPMMLPREKSIATAPETMAELLAVVSADWPGVTIPRLGSEVLLPTALRPLERADAKPMSVLVAEGLACAVALEGKGSVRSIECAHIHLDRSIDTDQVVGAALGAAVLQHFAAIQAEGPELLPMVDDDHVMVALTPQAFSNFFSSMVRVPPSELIPESSPIVRALVTCLWERLKLCAPANLRMFGGNVYADLPSGGICELFEDFAGECANGCVLFEAALLVYRSDRPLWKYWFNAHAGTNEDIHAATSAILNRDCAHDLKRQILTEYYSRFAGLTDPRLPNAGLVCEFNEIVSTWAPVHHLNVLEEYYESQQEKVRALLALLRLPVYLSTLHFNAATATVRLVPQ